VTDVSFSANVDLSQVGFSAGFPIHLRKIMALYWARELSGSVDVCLLEPNDSTLVGFFNVGRYYDFHVMPPYFADLRGLDLLRTDDFDRLESGLVKTFASVALTEEEKLLRLQTQILMSHSYHHFGYRFTGKLSDVSSQVFLIDDSSTPSTMVNLYMAPGSSVSITFDEEKIITFKTLAIETREYLSHGDNFEFLDFSDVKRG
jgi:hypothetical protein